MPLIYKILINQEFENGLLYVPILLFATYFSNISGFYGGIFTAYKDTKIMGSTTFAASIINLIINLLLIKNIGLFAAAVSTLVSSLVIYLYRKLKVKKYVKLCENNYFSILSIIISIVVLVIYYIDNIYLHFLNCVISIIFAIYTNKDLLLMILDILKSRRKKC